MGQAKGGRMVFKRIRGRDGGTVSPLDIPEGFAAEVLNTDLDGSGLGVKRQGLGLYTPSNAFPGGLTADVLLVHPRANRGDVVLYGIAFSGGPGFARLPLATDTWSAAFTLSDNPNADPVEAAGVPFHDKFMLAYNTAVDRMHVVDGDTTVLRRMGIAPPAAAPTVADTGAGAYAATPRWYQQSFRNISGSTVLAESERSSSVAFTPSGGGTHARITKAATPAGETVTHWVVWASETSTSGPFYELVQVAIGTGTYDDNAAPADYDNGTAAQLAGTFTVVPSCRYVMSDGGNRLLFAGAYETGGFTSRVWFTPVLGSLGRGDDERYLNQSSGDGGIKHYVDLEEDAGGIITALGGPLNGHPIVFKESQIWRLVPTSDVVAPYRPVKISPSIGCINQRTVVSGVDESGAPCLYFAAVQGPYRLTIDGRLQYLGHDVEDYYSRRTSSVAFAAWEPKRQLYILHWAVVEGQTRFRFHAKLGRPDDAGRVRGGWSRDTVSSTVTMFFVPSATPEHGEVYVYASGILILDDHTATDDNGTNFQGYVELPAQAPAGLGTRVKTGTPMVVGKAGSGTPTITVTQLKDYSGETRAATVGFTTTRAHRLCEQGAGMSDCDVIAFRIGDGAADDAAWTLDALVVPWEPQEDLVSM